MLSLINKYRSGHLSTLSVLAIAAALLIGCGTTTITKSEMEEPAHAIVAAEFAGAKDHTLAQAHLEAANKQYEEAFLLMKSDKWARAKHMLNRAEVDAELALLQAQNVTVRDQVEDLEEQIADMRRAIAEAN